MLRAICFHFPFWFFKCRATLLNHPKSSWFWSLLLTEDFFSNMAITNTFHIDIQVTYSREQCNYIVWILLWSSSECLRISDQKDWLLIQLQIPIFCPGDFLDMEIFWSLSSLWCFIYEHYFRKREAVKWSGRQDS